MGSPGGDGGVLARGGEAGVGEGEEEGEDGREGGDEETRYGFVRGSTEMGQGHREVASEHVGVGNAVERGGIGWGGGGGGGGGGRVEDANRAIRSGVGSVDYADEGETFGGGEEERGEEVVSES